MRRIVLTIIFMLVLAGLLLAQSQQISVNCSPSEMFVNSLNASSFDAVNPQNQPVLTHITVNNLLPDQAYKFTMHIIIKWNDIEIIDFTSKSSNLLHYGIPGVYTNRDLISSSQTAFFDEPDGDVSIGHILDQSPLLSDALQSGFFPDGTLSFTFTATPDQEYVPNPVSSQAMFTIRIKNINTIFLTYPGKPVGQNPPAISVKPVTFMWNSINTVYNDYHLMIREFVPSNPPNLNSVETGGMKVFDNDVSDNVFSEFLPFQNNHYYAWQVSTPLYNEDNPNIITPKGNSKLNTLKSEWYVFKYVVDSDAMSMTYSQLRAILNSLNNPVIHNIFAQGFDVTGSVFYEGQVYTGEDAVGLARTLIGKEIDVEINDN